MVKKLKIKLLWVLVLSGCLFGACKKQETYDLFPLKEGNEFYYKYHYYKKYVFSENTDGTETWKVVSESSRGDSTTYLIECRLNATRIGSIGNPIIFSDSLSYMEITKDRSSIISIPRWNISFSRYQIESQMEIKRIEYPTELSLLFKADSGLTKYSNSKPHPNVYFYESLHLDSIKVSQ